MSVLRTLQKASIVYNLGCDGLVAFPSGSCMVTGHGRSLGINESLPCTCLRELGTPLYVKKHIWPLLEKLAVIHEGAVITSFDHCLLTL